MATGASIGHSIPQAELLIGKFEVGTRNVLFTVGSRVFLENPPLALARLNLGLSRLSHWDRLVVGRAFRIRVPDAKYETFSSLATTLGSAHGLEQSSKIWLHLRRWYAFGLLSKSRSRDDGSDP